MRLLERQIMDRKGVPSEPHVPRSNSPETDPLLSAYCDVASHSEIAGGSAVDGVALRRNEQDGKNIVHFTTHFEYPMQGILGRHMTTSLKTNDN